MGERSLRAERKPQRKKQTKAKQLIEACRPFTVSLTFIENEGERVVAESAGVYKEREEGQQLEAVGLWAVKTDLCR